MPDLRFDPIAKAYAEGRPDYPAAIYSEICDFAGRARFDTVVDIACGTGISLAGVSSIADRLIGIEPADDMRALAMSRMPDADIHKGTAENTGLEDACCDLVTVATAFHWFDREKALDEIARILRPGGVFATYQNEFPVIDGPANAVLDRHSNELWDSHRSPVLVHKYNSLEVMTECGHFARTEARAIPNAISFDAKRFGTYARSTSFGTAYAASLDDPEAYFQDFEAEIAGAATGSFDVNFDIFLNLGEVGG